MPNVSQATLDAEKATCPTCGAEPGRPCRSRFSGYVTALHPGRIHSGAIAAERLRARQELEEWLIGRIDPKDAGLVNGRRIVDEINRICPKEE